MGRFVWTTPLAALGLVASLTLAILVLWPATTEANCFPWEYQSRLVFESFGDCCSAVDRGAERIYRQQRRYRTPNCGWGPWQNTNIQHVFCVEDACPIPL